MLGGLTPGTYSGLAPCLACLRPTAPLQCVGDAVHLHRLVTPIPFGAAHRRRYSALLAKWLPVRGLARERACVDRQELLDHLEALLAALPAGLAGGGAGRG